MIFRDQKKVLSSSFSKVSISTVHQQKSGSFSADKLTSFKAEQKGVQKNIIVKVIEILNSKKEQAQSEWRIISFEQKRIIAGFKGFIEWYSPIKDLKVVFKISISNNFFRLINHLNGGDIFVEIKELNFALTIQEQRQLQEIIQKILASSIQTIKGKNFNDQIKKQTQCIKIFLIQVNNQFQKKIYQNKKKCVQKIDPNLSKKLILYPAPVAFAWNPLGSICITQNKYPNYKKTFSGDPNSFRKYFETSKHEAVIKVDEEDNRLNLSSDMGNNEAIYDWKIEQQIDLIIFNRQKSQKQQQGFYINRAKDELQSQSKKQEQKNDEQGIILVSLNRLSSNKLRKLYERYFGVRQNTYQFNRHDKLRVYDVRSYNRDHQDDIVYIIQKLSMAHQDKQIESLFANDVSAYPNFLQAINNSKYKMLGSILRRSLSDPKMEFCTYLKIFILENQFVGKQIEKYFKSMYKLINKMPHHLLYYLGSYNHFDNIKGELFLMDLLQKTIDLNEYTGIQIADSYNEFMVKIKKKVKLPKIHYQSLLTEAEKNGFFTKLFPILIVKDREMEKFQFKQIKRIITANSKIFMFIKKTNQILTKLEEGKTTFIKTIIENYKKFNQIQENSNSVNIKPRTLFYVHCRFCQMATKIYELDAKEYLQFCSKLKLQSLSINIFNYEVLTLVSVP